MTGSSFDVLAETLKRREGKSVDARPLEVTPETSERYVETAPEELGRGGLGRVYAAFDRHLGREIAIKELQEGDETADDSWRLAQEARITGHLEHPSIVPVYELGRREDGTFYYAMKRVRGRTLKAALEECKTLEDRLGLLPHFLDVSQALAFAHSRGVIHRDVKPANVMVGQFGETVLLDWGLAKVAGIRDPLADEVQHSIVRLASGEETMAGDAIGTPAYMSPEQARGEVEAIDEQSDVWALGVMLYQLLTGRLPFPGPSADAVVRAVLENEPARIEKIVPSAPSELVAVAERAMAKDTKQRYATAAEIAEEIAAYEAGNRVRAYDYGSVELVRRFVAKNAMAVMFAMIAVLALAVGVVVSLSALTKAEAAREVAEQRERDGQKHLAHAYTERAERLIQDKQYGAAAVYAAAANGFHQSGSLGSPDPTKDQSELNARIETAIHASGALRRAFLECTIPGQFILFLDDQDELVSFTPGTKTATIWRLADCSVEKTVTAPDLKPKFGAMSLASEAGAVVVGERTGLKHWRPRESGLRKITTSSMYLPTFSTGAGKVFAARRIGQTREGRISGIDTRTGETITDSAAIHRPYGLALSPDEKFLLATVPSGLMRFEAETLESDMSISPAKSAAYLEESQSAAFSGYSGVVEAWDWHTLKSKWRRTDLDVSVKPCTHRKAHSVVLAQASGPLLVEPETGETLERLPAATQCVMAASGRRFGTRNANAWRLWSLRPPKAEKLLTSSSPVRRAWLSSKRDRLAVMRPGGKGTSVTLHEIGDAESEPLEVATAAHTDALAAFSRDGRWLATYTDHAVHLKDLATGKSEIVRQVPKDATVFKLEDVTFSPDSKLLGWTNADNGQTVGLYDLEKKKRLPDVLTGLARPNQIAFSTDGKTLAVSGPKAIEVWNVEARSRQARMESEMNPYILTALDVNPKTGWIAFAGRNGKTYLHSGSGEAAPVVLKSSFLGDEGTVVFSPNGQFLCAGDDTHLVIWDVGARREALRINDTTEVCEFTTDSKAIMTGLGKEGLFVVPLGLDGPAASPKVLIDEAERSYPMTLPRP